MRSLFYLGHPAHFHLFRNAMHILREQKHQVGIVIKKKDVLEDLVRTDGWDYVNINPGGRQDNLLSIGWNLVKRDIRFIRLCRTFKPDKLFGTAAEPAHAGRLLGIPSLIFNEDDWHVVPLFALLTYPFATHIISPEAVSAGRWEKKKIAYKGFHELAYLHPDRFTPDPAVARRLRQNSDRYFILRFSSLGAHHDAGRRGIDDTLAARLAARLALHGPVYVSSERRLPAELAPLRIPIDPREMHSALYYASLYVGDSQTMAAEAAVLGTPAIRCNDFAGALSYLRELEEEYGLGFSCRPAETDRLFRQLDTWLADPDLKKSWAEKRQKMLLDCIDLTQLIVELALR